MMSQTDRPEDENPVPSADPAPIDTGSWPLPATAEPAPAPGAEPGPGPQSEEAGEAVPGIAQPGDQPPSPGQPGPAAEAPPGILDAINDLGARLDQRLAGLQTLFEREIRAEATRERIVDRLHAELQDYKQDLFLKVQRPIFIDLIQLHDDIGKMIEAQPPDDPDRLAAVRGTLESIRTAIEDILYRQGVEPFQQAGDEFDPRRQRAVTTVPTEEPELNKTVANRLRPGFQAGDKLIRPEIVSVYTLKRPS
jgi:molecular chaperone GrpE